MSGWEREELEEVQRKVDGALNALFPVDYWLKNREVLPYGWALHADAVDRAMDSLEMFRRQLGWEIDDIERRS